MVCTGKVFYIQKVVLDAMSFYECALGVGDQLVNMWRKSDG